ncbi:thiol reductant ABC exporter subunit CydC [Brachybacterium squillarum]|uniref:thiol reductant ABC exporter subunit CydC n=1 Tax=Brachybacterium squillarum TaxID=661979 RepID=UPI002222EA62|nr:thiol reductant ABC exporter subunit CydC [Brachybacterium squillarum]MCW1805329.1 thiol reductant ABC exporter subunit CydC [Brachybacterium squillarum]
MTALRTAERALAIPRGRLLAAVLAAAATAGAAFALAAVSAYLVTRAWTMPPVLDLTVAVVAVRALGVSRAVLRWLDRMLVHDVALRGVVSLRATLFTALASRRDDAVTRLRRGDLLTRLGDDAQELGDHVVSAIVPALVAAVMAVVAVATIAPISPLGAAAMLLGQLVAAILAPAAAHRAARVREEAVVEGRAGVGTSLLEILDDATSLRLEGRLDESLAGLAASQRRQDRALDRAALPAALATAAVPLAIALTVLGSLIAAGAAWSAGAATAGQIGVLVLLPLSAFEAATALPAAAAQHARSRSAAARLEAAAGERWDAARPEPARSVERAITAPLHAQGLTAGWSAGAPVVRDLDLDLPAGSRLAMLGPSGSGKTTLLLTLAGLLDPLEGTVDAAGQDPRQQVTAFPEDAHVFATTLRENLRVVRGDLADEEALAALGAVGLAAWVDTLPAGLDTLLGPDGTTVSGGERRRLLLARAVVRRGPVLLLDEPTEHLDAARGDALLRALLTPGDESLVPATSTVVVVTHRESAIPPSTPVLRIEELR